MRKKIYMLLCMGLALLLPFAASAEPYKRSITLTGTVVAGETVPILAPFGGMITENIPKAGDMVASGDRLFTLSTQKVYAPCDGIVGSIGARPGDDAAYLTERYGGLMYLEPMGRFTISADTKNAYSDENKVVSVGETVYIGSRKSAKRTGMGFITAVDGNTFTVEMTSGNLIAGDEVSIFRDHDFASASKIGTGTAALQKSVPIQGEGSIFKVHVNQGDFVRRGDLLMETVDGSLGHNPFPTNMVVSGYDAIVASVEARAGDVVEKNKLLATLYPLDSLKIEVGLLETDLRDVQVGDSVDIELPGHGDGMIKGTVEFISALHDSEASDVLYTVTIAFAADAAVRVGMSANVYFNMQ